MDVLASGKIRKNFFVAWWYALGIPRDKTQIRIIVFSASIRMESVFIFCIIDKEDDFCVCPMRDSLTINICVGVSPLSAVTAEVTHDHCRLFHVRACRFIFRDEFGGL